MRPDAERRVGARAARWRYGQGRRRSARVIGGTLTVYADGPGKVAAFTLTLPLSA